MRFLFRQRENGMNHCHLDGSSHQRLAHKPSLPMCVECKYVAWHQQPSLQNLCLLPLSAVDQVIVFTQYRLVLFFYMRTEPLFPLLFWFPLGVGSTKPVTEWRAPVSAPSIYFSCWVNVRHVGRTDCHYLLLYF